MVFMYCIGMFLWNIIDSEKTKPIWLAAAVMSLAAGVIGFLLTR